MLICLLFSKPGSPGAFGHSRLQPIGPFPPTPVCPRPAGSSVPQASSGSDPQDPHGCRLCSSDGAACLIHAARGQLTMGAAPPIAGLMPLGLSQLAQPQNVGRKKAGKQTPTWRHSTTQGARSVHACVCGYVRMHVCLCLRVCMDHIHTHGCIWSIPTVCVLEPAASPHILNFLETVETNNQWMRKPQFFKGEGRVSFTPREETVQSSGSWIFQDLPSPTVPSTGPVKEP